MEMLLVNVALFISIVVVFVTALFLVMQTKGDNSLIDIAYGPLFFFSSLTLLLLINIYTPLVIIMLTCIGMWSLRLAYRIFTKNYGKGEDERYKNWRIQWTKRGNIYFVVRSFLQINFLQGIIITLVALPFILATTTKETSLPVLVYLGVVIFAIGFLIEVIADKQLDAFLAKKKAGTTTEPIMKTGLFRYSRRPNYFGETLIWWGLAVMVLPLHYGYLALISPLLITYIVVYITGPMLEKIFIDRYGEQYKTYMLETSYFIPLPPKR